ncbi:glutaredoxin domain-containing protein, partial [Cupriavidus pauculus]
CVSVNDTFVMNEWAKDQESENIVMIPDGNGEFTDGMGMLVDKADLGFGKRSWRYSMVVKNGVVDKMFIEPEEPGDPFKVSDADTMLNYIQPDAKRPDQVVVFSKVGCSHCAKAKQLLQDKGYEYIDVPLDNKIRGKVLGAMSGEMTAPQVFINGNLVGGAVALELYLAAS